MPKKNMSPEERKAWGEKMKAARAAKKLETKEPEVNTEDYQALLRRVRELETNFKNAEAQGRQAEFQADRGVQVGNRGNLVGSFEKYILDKSHYPDPRERLSHEARLQRFAFLVNNTLNWDVSTTNYQTQDGVNVREPRFKLELVSLHRDDDGELNGEAHIIRTMIFHEDPDTAMTIANEQGIEVGNDQKSFLDEMRYLRMRDWLLDCFYPKPAATNKKKREEVIGNRVVEVYEINSQDSQAIPFGDLSGKI